MLFAGSEINVAPWAYNARHKREQLVASRAPNGRVFDGDCYMPNAKLNTKPVKSSKKPKTHITYLHKIRVTGTM